MVNNLTDLVIETTITRLRENLSFRHAGIMIRIQSAVSPILSTCEWTEANVPIHIKHQGPNF